MSFTAITTPEVTSGKPVTADVGLKIKDNFDDHESRLLSIEGGAGTTYPSIVFRVNGPYYHGWSGTITGLVKSAVNFSITITGVRLIIDTAGSSGTTEIDVKFKRGGGSWTSILSTKPTVAFGAGDDATSSNGVVDAANNDLLAGDLLRLDLTSVQTGGSGFTVRIDYVAT